MVFKVQLLFAGILVYSADVLSASDTLFTSRTGGMGCVIEELNGSDNARFQVQGVSWDGQFSFVSQQLGWAVARSETEIALVKTENGGESWSIIEPKISFE